MRSHLGSGWYTVPANPNGGRMERESDRLPATFRLGRLAAQMVQSAADEQGATAER